MLVSVLALAVAANPGPLAVVQNIDAEVQKVLKSDNPTVEKLAERADTFVDFGELARRAMGSDWNGLKKKQQDEFTATMKGLLRASYAQKAISDDRVAATVEYGAEKIEGNEATVPSTLTLKKDKFEVIYKLYRPNEKAAWRVYDVITDEVSLVGTYQDQFRKVMAKSGFDGLLEQLKKKKEKVEADNAAKKDEKKAAAKGDQGGDQGGTKPDVAKAGTGGGAQQN